MLSPNPNALSLRSQDYSEELLTVHRGEDSFESVAVLVRDFHLHRSNSLVPGEVVLLLSLD